MASHTVGGTKQVSVLPTLRAVVCVAQDTRLILVLLHLPHAKSIPLWHEISVAWSVRLCSKLSKDLGIVTGAEVAVLVGFDFSIQASSVSVEGRAYMQVRRLRRRTQRIVQSAYWHVQLAAALFHCENPSLRR